MFCTKCGTQNNDNNFKCTNCSYVLHQHETYVAHDDSTFSGLIPYKNSRALIAYYLGVASMIPFFGIFFGIAAFILGLKGLQFAKKYPESKGKVHAWIGIIAGGLFGTAYLIIALILYSVLNRSN